MYNPHNLLSIMYNKLSHLCGQIILTLFHSSICKNYISSNINIAYIT